MAGGRTFEVRRAVRADVDVVARLFDAYRQVYGKRADLPLARAFLHDRIAADESVVFLAADGAEALGFAQLYPSFSSLAARRIWVVNDLFVAPSARRRGVGRALMEAARGHAVGTGAGRLILRTDAANRGAQRLYESLGYVSENEGIRFYALKLP